MRILHFTDIASVPGIDAVEWIDREATRFAAEPPDLAVCTGDISELPDPVAYRAIAESVRQWGVDTLWVPGDRDDAALYLSAFGRRYQTTSAYPHIDRLARIGGVPLILLDTRAGLVSENQRLWLRSQLTELQRVASVAGAGDSVLVFSHVPILPVGSTAPEESREEAQRGRHQALAVSSCRGIPAAAEVLRDFCGAESRLRVSIFAGHCGYASVTEDGRIRQYVREPGGTLNITIDHFGVPGVEVVPGTIASDRGRNRAAGR